MLDLELFLDAAADRGDDRADFLVREHLVDARLLDVDDLAAQRQDRLELAPAALLGRAAGRVALDEVELAERRIGERAVGELARQVADVERRLASREVARLARRFARARRRHGLLDDDVRRARMLLEVRGEPLVDERLDRRLDLGVAELGLGLPLELRLANLHREHRGEAFAHVVAGEREVRLLEEIALLRVRVDDARERGLEAGEVRAAFVRVDVVDEGEDVLVVAVVVLHRELDADVVARRLDVDDFGVQRLAGRVQVLHELLEAALRVEGLRLLLAGALVGERDHHALVQERQLAQAHRERVVADR